MYLKVVGISFVKKVGKNIGKVEIRTFCGKYRERSPRKVKMEVERNTVCVMIERGLHDVLILYNFVCD